MTALSHEERPSYYILSSFLPTAQILLLVFIATMRESETTTGHKFFQVLHHFPSPRAGGKKGEGGEGVKGAPWGQGRIIPLSSSFFATQHYQSDDQVPPGQHQGTRPLVSLPGSHTAAVMLLGRFFRPTGPTLPPGLGLLGF